MAVSFNVKTDTNLQRKKFIVGFSFVFGDVLRLSIVASFQARNAPKSKVLHIGDNKKENKVKKMQNIFKIFILVKY